MAKPVNDRLFDKRQASVVAKFPGFPPEICFIISQKSESRYLVEHPSGKQRIVKLSNVAGPNLLKDRRAMLLTKKGDVVRSFQQNKTYVYTKGKNKATQVRQRFKDITWPHIVGMYPDADDIVDPPIEPEIPSFDQGMELFDTLDHTTDWELYGEFDWPLEFFDNLELSDDWELWSDSNDLYDMLELDDQLQLSV